MIITGCLAFACATDTIEAEGEFGRAVPLASGDASSIPRLLTTLGPCPGAADGCTSVCNGPPATCPEDACMPVVIDSLSPVTAIASDAAIVTAERGCIEVRAAEGTLAADPGDALDDAVARFRFHDLPLARVPADDSVWSWQVGDERASSHVAAILGGNLLRTLAIRFVDDGEQQPTVAFYRSFPGSETTLADQGRAFLPLQFPGQLLGKEITDVCAVNGESCDFLGLRFDTDRVRSLIQPTHMVLDACLAPPPELIAYDVDARRCRLAVGTQPIDRDFVSPTGNASLSCQSAAVIAPGPDAGGLAASLVVATGIPGLVLFRDSAERFFGDLAALPECAPEQGTFGGFGLDVAACRDGSDGALYPPGWPAAGIGDEAPLQRIRVRSLGLVPGLTNAMGISPCQRLELRLAALKEQCDGVVESQLPYAPAESVCSAAAAQDAVILGEVHLTTSVGANPTRWLRTLVLPEDHPLAMAIRRDVTPEALQPDGLLGTALLRGTDVILDYTDESPGIRVACTTPGDGSCLALPSCNRRDGAVAPSCCHGLPPALLTEMIVDFGHFGCCPALSDAAQRELNCKAEFEGREAPCPENPC